MQAKDAVDEVIKLGGTKSDLESVFTVAVDTIYAGFMDTITGFSIEEKENYASFLINRAEERESNYQATLNTADRKLALIDMHIANLIVEQIKIQQSPEL